LYKIRTDGSGKLRITRDKANNLLIENEWLYYVNESDHSMLYKIKKDGTERTNMAIDNIRYFTLFGDWIYYISKDNVLKKVKTNGSDNGLVINW